MLRATYNGRRVQCTCIFHQMVDYTWLWVFVGVCWVLVPFFMLLSGVSVYLGQFFDFEYEINMPIVF